MLWLAPAVPGAGLGARERPCRVAASFCQPLELGSAEQAPGRSRKVAQEGQAGRAQGSLSCCCPSLQVRSCRLPWQAGEAWSGWDACRSRCGGPSLSPPRCVSWGSSCGPLLGVTSGSVARARGALAGTDVSPSSTLPGHSVLQKPAALPCVGLGPFCDGCRPGPQLLGAE